MPKHKKGILLTINTNLPCDDTVCPKLFINTTNVKCNVGKEMNIGFI